MLKQILPAGLAMLVALCTALSAASPQVSSDAATDVLPDPAIGARFFSAYDAHDAEAMLREATSNATMRYVPVSGGMGAEQSLREDGKVFFEQLWTTFPDLTVELHDAAPAAGSRLYCRVSIGGTQTKSAFGIENKGRSFDLEHLFVLELDDAGKIEKLTAYYDDATWYGQLGRTQIKELKSAE